MERINRKKLLRFLGICLMAVVSCCFAGCGKNTPDHQPKVNPRELKKIEDKHPVHIYRYDQALFSLPQENLEKSLDSLQRNYAFFLGDEPSVPQLKAYLNDPINRRLYKEVQEKYADMSDVEQAFQDAFARLRLLFPDMRIPRIYTIISGLSYETPIIYVDSVLIISLDMYMGKDYHYYKQLGEILPLFIRRRLAKEYLLADCMKALSYQVIHSNNASVSILDDMILEGKRWMFAEIALPDTPDSLICGYTREQLAWIQTYEYDVWSFLIEKNYLYSNDNLVSRKLVGEAPFTAFFGKQSPGNIGSWIGWQICRAWMAKNKDSDLAGLFEEKDPQIVLKNARYKPVKK